MRILQAAIDSHLTILNNSLEQPSESGIIARTQKCWMMKNNDRSESGGSRQASTEQVRQELERLHIDSMKDLGNMIISGATLNPMGVLENFSNFNTSNGKYHETRERLAQMEEHKSTKEERRQERQEWANWEHERYLEKEGAGIITDGDRN